MKNLKFAIWIFLLWLVQSVFSNYIRIGGIAPELLYVFVLCMAMLEKKPSYYISISIICGLLADISAGGMIGFYLLTFTGSTLLLVGLGSLFYREYLLMILPVILLFSFAVHSIYYLINHNILNSLSYPAALKSIIVPVMLYNTAVGLLIHPLLKKSMYKRSRRR